MSRDLPKHIWLMSISIGKRMSNTPYMDLMGWFTVLRYSKQLFC